MLDDTICAPASAPVNSPVGVIRISGPGTIGTARLILTNSEKLSPRYALYCSVKAGGEFIDDVIAVYYKAPSSFTGEDMLDIFCHGNPLIIKKIIKLIISSGIRIAAPGEFSRRAFLNGKIDLTEAEAINHIITGQSEWEISSAIKQMHGALRIAVNEIREMLIRLKADIEAAIDFITEDIEFVSYDEAAVLNKSIRAGIENLLRRCRIGSKMAHGIDVPIVGRQNVGKSSILNLILNSERAIVSDIPGTTRDLINEIVQFGGIRINLIDTAGIGATNCAIEKMGIERSTKKIETSPLLLVVIDAAAGICEADAEILEKIKHKPRIILANKTDKCISRECIDSLRLNFKNESVIEIIPFSAVTSEGLDKLEKAVEDFIRSNFADYENSFVADIRVINILEEAVSICDNCDAAFAGKAPHEIAASELQSLMDKLSEITGSISPDDVLDSVFSRFCIGK